jgi:predicted amidohydrolase YtcJ
VGGADAEVIADGAVAVRGSRIIYVGSDRGVSALIGEATEVIDGSGGMVLPGFVDSHAHPYSGTERLECDLSGDSTVAQLHDSIRRCAVARPRAAWLRGTGWQLPVFPDANPLRQQLDSLVSDRPAFLVAADGHSAWVNSAALGRAGITAATPDPANGRIERDERGNPSGTLRESAMDLVARLIPPYTAEDHVRGFQAAFAEAVGFGITAMVDADADSAMLEAYRLMDSAGTLPVRISAAQHLGPGSVADLVSRVQRFRDRYSSPLVSANGAKIFMDGVIEARTAALLEPYLDRAGDRGQPSLPQARLDSLVRELDRLGVQVHVHAIGDRAIRMALDAFERAAQQNGTGDRRHQIAHLELIDPADIGRFMRLGVIANFQPLWAYDDSYIVELTIPALGAARSRWLYPLRSVLATGATVTAGSDWSVSSMDPLEAIQVGVTRRALDAGPGPGWIPQEQARLQDLLAAYTIVGAFGRRAEGSTGSLEAGKLADLVLLDRNLFQVPPHQLAEARVLLTVMDGRVRFRRPAAR